MAVSFQIYSGRGLAHIRFAGYITVAETLAKAEAFSKSPGVTPFLNQIIDFSAVTGFERDYQKLMVMLARLPDHLLHPGQEPLFVYVAPTEVGQEMAVFVMRAMEGLPGPILRLTRTLPEALTILGLPDRLFDPADLPDPGP